MRVIGEVLAPGGRWILTDYFSTGERPRPGDRRLAPEQGGRRRRPGPRRYSHHRGCYRRDNRLRARAQLHETSSASLHLDFSCRVRALAHTRLSHYRHDDWTFCWRYLEFSFSLDAHACSCRCHYRLVACFLLEEIELSTCK